MIIDTLKTLFKRDLEKLKTEIELYKNEKNIWLIDKSISNSAGNLCLHIIGNLNAYIGVGLAKTSYIRRRDLEFSLKHIPRTKILSQITDTIQIVENGLDNLTLSQITDDFPIVIWDKPTEMEYTLTHLLTHLNHHLGQINYHRRLLDK
ncbi:DUF1572 family protein [Polaribacter sp. Hel1_85]|uniref:DUF1572 family protein n=1 Tax=Polaribacter sp. Hel1_85 TaxID=1250005 RepID=UPI00052D7C6A|nr:DUF1572 family protein [Polaribacter sp. Hel1_85]KGL61712.1 hypothetical protein PHEL85_1493 [Polaribacter sp. Hel1_85]